MSDQVNSEKIASQWFSALDRGDIDAAMSLLAPDVEWVNLPKVPGVSDIISWLGTCHGVEEVRNSFRVRDAVAEVQLFKPGKLIVQGDQAFGTVHDISRIKSTGAEFDIEFATWMQIRNDKIVRWKSYCDPSPIIAAFRYRLDEQLLLAIDADDVALAQQLLQMGADANARDGQTGLTGLMLAACHANAALVEALLAAGADPFTTDSQTGATALHKAAQGGSVEVARMLVEAGAFVDAVTPTMGHTPIMDGLWYKGPEYVKYLVDRGANLHFGTHYGFSMMEHLQFELNVNTLGKEKLLEIDETFKQREQADQDAIGNQKVMAATNNGDTEAVQRLIAEGADINTVYPHVNTFSDGHTPLLVAARDNHAEIVRELLDADAQVRVVDWVFKGSPIHKATYNGRPEILRMILDHADVDIDVQGPINGYTPLHDALWHGYTECAEMLLDAGCRLDLKGHDGKTPLQVAIDVYGPDADVVRRIRETVGTTPAKPLVGG
ncbi:ankyrin repeat domain-containing protein [Mycobacterium sp.]|uniref:ankyrin repeat domain-containing protein n=1 Tax=Mycobacterium sp. TaxID=1785 RepID=UPI003F97DF2E